MKHVSKTNPLTKRDIEKTKIAYNNWKSSEQKIFDRSNYILHKTAEMFGGKIEWWDWDEEHFDISMMSDEAINVYGKTKCRGAGEWVAILNGDEWELKLAFPRRWLLEDFEQELSEGIKKYNEEKITHLEIEKQKTLTRKSNRQKLLNSAKEKLTKEERKALRL